MKGLMTYTAVAGIALLTATLNIPSGNDSVKVTSSEISTVPKSQTGPSPLGGVVPPLDLSAASPLDGAWERSRTRSEPHGHEACASGCAVSHHPTPRLTTDHCRTLLAEYQQEPFDQGSESLDALLYFDSQTRFQLRKDSLRELLDADHLTFLQRELSRDQAIVSLRMIDQHGKVRAGFPATEVPQHVRQVFECDVDNLQPLVCSGTVKRVGKNHIWQRL
jgi:hypothetical protein